MYGGRLTALAHHDCEGIHQVTPTSVYDAHGIEEEEDDEEEEEEE